MVLFAGLFFVVLAWAQELEHAKWLDQAVSEWFRRHRAHGWIRAVRGVTRVGDGWVLTAVTVVTASVLWRHARRAALYLIGTGVGVALLCTLLKHLFQRARPEAAARLVEAGGYAFPSGHSMGSAAVYGAVAVVIAAHWSRVQALTVVGCVLLVIAAGLSRVYLGVHYFSDVLAGWALGAAWALGLAGAMRVRRRPTPSPLPLSSGSRAPAGVAAKRDRVG